ncbi:MAG: vWA domain-containing protein [Pseudomonadota bacterium]
MMAQPAEPETRTVGAMARARLAAFVRSLRANGFTVGLAETQDALRVLSSPAAARPQLLGEAFKALFCSRQEEWARFDEIFDAFWRGRGMKVAVRAAGQPKPGTRPRQLAPGAPGEERRRPAERGLAVERGEGTGEEETSGAARARGASSAESLAETDLRHIVDAEALAEAHRLAERLARAMRYRLTRRERSRRHGRRLDLRRTIHRSIGRGGTPLDLVRRRRKDKPLRLVVLLDVSGSMSLYSTVFARFLHGLVACSHEAEAYLFHTRLVHISDALRERDPERAVERLALMAQGWSGGTRIGECLAAFNRWHAPRLVHSRTVVIILSDGYDTGDPAALAREMAALKRRARRIVWLNPMMGWKDYAPVAAGMQAALPHVDLFAPAHNLASLAALEPYLARL